MTDTSPAMTDTAPATPEGLASAETGEQSDTADQDQDRDDAEGQDDDNRPAREAAKYRRKLRAVEGERDQLAQRLTTLQRGEAERLAADQLADAADLWRDGLDLAELLDDDGHLDPDKVTAAAESTLRTHPHWKKAARRTPAPGAGGGLKSGASNPADLRSPSWSQVLREGVRGSRL